MYSEKREIKYSDLSPLKQASLPAILRFYQDAAINHSARAGYPISRLYEDNRAWILISMNTEIIRYPQDREIITVSTFPTSFARCYGFRSFKIEDGDKNVICRAASFWVMMNITEKKPVRIYDGMAAKYGLEADDTLEYIRREPQIGECRDICPVIVGKRDIDTNNHVNNVKLAEFVLEAVPLEKQIKSAQIYYSHSCYEGEHLKVQACENGGTIGSRLVDPDGVVRVSAKFEV